MRILVMGLPGSGKTTLSNEIRACMEERGIFPVVFNADEVRTKFNDWDFSIEGRIRQARRMRDLAAEHRGGYVISDFVAPLEEMRMVYDADWTIWMDTVDESAYEDTNRMFVAPERYDFRITEKDARKWAAIICSAIFSNKRRPVFDWKKETVQMLGRWQPWHDGHMALFKRAVEKTGQVVIMIRDCQGWNKSNPFDMEFVKNRIRRSLDPIYQGQYEILVVPNIVNITYGRDVGYSIEQEVFCDDVHGISATKIREGMGLP